MDRKTLTQIKLEDISPNPHNPRLVFNEEEMNELKKSIDKVGILVPITVYENTKKSPSTKYVLLDGERRWRCAKELHFEKIPANVIDEPEDITQNILFMFNIHHFRKEWALFPTALKLDIIIKKIGTDSEKTISEFTGVSRAMIRRCKMLLWYPPKYRGILLEKGGKISADFFLELYPIAYRLSQEPEFDYPKGTINLVDSLIKIYNEGKLIEDAREFREIRKCLGYYENKNDIDVFKEILLKFLADPSSTLNIFYSPDIETDQARKNIVKYIDYLNNSLVEINPNIISDSYIVDQLKRLDQLLTDLLNRIE